MRFNEGQQKLLKHKAGFALVSATAGAGKSTVLIEKIRIMVQEDGITPSNIMITTFTKNSAEDLVNKLAKVGVEGVQVGTFHSICGRILSKLGMFGKEVKKYEVDNIFNKILLSDKPNIQEIWSWISYQKNFNKTPDSEQFEPKELENATIGEARKCFKAYEDYKKKNGMMDMDDVLIKVLNLLKEDDGYLDTFKVDYLLVDEAMDSNKVQYELMYRLCRGNNITIVGDLSQTLYEWRGSSPQDFLAFADNDGCEIINFNTNYRSCKNIVEHANVFCNNYLKTNIYVDAIANNQEDGEITHNFYYTFEDEAIAVAKKIKNMIDNGTEPKDIAVLYRNNQMSQLIELELKQLEVPYYVDASSSFFKIKEIETIICALRLIINKNDDLAFDTIFNNRIGCFKYIPASIIKNIKTIADNSEMSHIDASRDVRVQGRDWITRNMRAFADEIETLSRKSNKLSVRELISEVIDLLEIKTCIKTNIYYDQDQKDAKMNALRVLDSFVGDFSSIDKLLTFAYSEQKKKKKDGEDNVVNLMTIHKSKGLEFENVFLTGNKEFSFPSIKSNIRSEGCLFFVGVTRAKRNLYLSSVEQESQFITCAFSDIINNSRQEIEDWEDDFEPKLEYCFEE